MERVDLVIDRTQNHGPRLSNERKPDIQRPPVHRAAALEGVVGNLDAVLGVSRGRSIQSWLQLLHKLHAV